MKTTWTFFRYELRRYLPVVGALWLLILALPWLDRGRVESWIADADARTAAAVVMLQMVAPLLALGLALWSWLGEKTTGSARFVYARPLSGDRRFGARLAAVATSVAVYVTGVFVGLWVSPVRVFEAFGEIGSPYAVLSNPWLNLMWDLAGGSWLVLLFFLGAGGTLVSVAVRRASRAVGLLALGTLVFVGLLHGAWWVSSASGWLRSWNERWIGGAYLLFVLLCGVGLLLAAWVAVRRAPLGPLPWRRMALVAMAPLGLAFLGVAPLNLSPLDVGEPRVLEEVPWSGGGTLALLRTPATQTEIAFVSLRREGEETRIRRPVDLLRYETPGPELAVFFDPSEPAWFAIDPQGEVHELEFPGGKDPMVLLPVNRARLGDGFAWTEMAGGTLWWMDRDRVMQRISIPREAGGGLWIDEDEIYLLGGRDAWIFHTGTESLEGMSRKAGMERLREARERKD